MQKKKPKADDDEAAAAEEPAADDEGDELDFSLKKKKKKPKDVAEDAGPAEEGDELDFSKKKKKKKPKALVADDDDDEPIAEGMANLAVGDEGAGEGEDGEEDADGDEETGFVSIPADREYKYEELLDRMYSLLVTNNPELAGDRKRFLMKPPQVVREGSKRVVIINFGDICRTLNRSMDHVFSFMLAEMGTTGSIDASSRMVVKGRYPPKAIEQLIRRYVGEYVSCSSCKSPNTALQKQARHDHNAAAATTALPRRLRPPGRVGASTHRHHARGRIGSTSCSATTAARGGPSRRLRRVSSPSRGARARRTAPEVLARGARDAGGIGAACSRRRRRQRDCSVTTRSGSDVHSGAPTTEALRTSRQREGHERFASLASNDESRRNFRLLRY